MKNFKFLLIVLLAVFLSSSCAIVYAPSKVNAPLLNQKNSSLGELSIGTTGVDMNLAYSPVEHLGIMLNGSFANADTTEDNYEIHQYFDFAFGYYKKIRTKFIFETYVGYGGGNIISQSNFLSFSYSNMKYQKFFLQPAIGYSSNYLEAGLATRLSTVKFFPIEGNTELTGKNYLFFEPVIFARLGYKHIFFTTEFGASFTNMPNKLYMPVIVTVGIGVKLGNIFLPQPRYSR